MVYESPKATERNELVSVFMPTHNRRKLLERSLDSVLNQTYQNLDVIIVDDGSTDDTWSYLCRISDTRVRIFRNPEPLGACAARNNAIFQAKGKLITGIDDDDIFSPTRVEELVRAYDTKYAFIYPKKFTPRMLVSSPFVTISRRFNLYQLFNSNLVGGFCLCETERLRNVGGFDVNFPALQDYELWIRMVEAYGAPRLVFSNTYVVDAAHGGLRVTNNKNLVRAYDLLLDKHAGRMAASNINSIDIRKTEWDGRSVHFLSVLRAIFDGNFWTAMRYLRRQVWAR